MFGVKPEIIEKALNMLDLENKMKTICEGCCDLNDKGKCTIWTKPESQLFIKHGGYCIRNDRRTVEKSNTKLNPIKQSKRGRGGI